MIAFTRFIVCLCANSVCVIIAHPLSGRRTRCPAGVKLHRSHCGRTSRSAAEQEVGSLCCTEEDEEDSDEEDSDDDDDDEEEGASAPEGAYDPADYHNLPVSTEIKELFQYITRYDDATAQHVLIV